MCYGSWALGRWYVRICIRRLLYLASSATFNWGEGKRHCHVRCDGLAPIVKEACTLEQDAEYDRVLATMYPAKVYLVRIHLYDATIASEVRGEGPYAESARSYRYSPQYCHFRLDPLSRDGHCIDTCGRYG